MDQDFSSMSFKEIKNEIIHHLKKEMDEKKTTRVQFHEIPRDIIVTLGERYVEETDPEFVKSLHELGDTVDILDKEFEYYHQKMMNARRSLDRAKKQLQDSQSKFYKIRHQGMYPKDIFEHVDEERRKRFKIITL